MADDAKETKQETKPEAKTEAAPTAEKEAPAKGKGMFLWLILGIVILACGVGGFAIAQLMGGSVPVDPNAVQTKPAAAAKPEKAEAKKAEGKKAEKKGEGGKGGSVAPEPGKSWMYDKLDAVVANLNEPGVTRYVRVTVILEINGQADYTKTLDLLDEKKIVMQDWMTTYLAGLSLEDVRGSRSLNRIKREMLDQFNQLLFGQEKTNVDKVLFKEFAVQ
jgi:flagellar basal body-associated protein FliL